MENGSDGIKVYIKKLINGILDTISVGLSCNPQRKPYVLAFP